MPLINPPDILPEAMRFLLRTLLAHKTAACDKDELLTLVAPSGLRESLKAIDKNQETDLSSEAQKGGQVIAQKSLDALLALGLVEMRADKAFVSDAVRHSLKTAEALTASVFARLVRACIFQPEAANGRTPAHDLVSAIALMFATEEPLKPFHFEGEYGRRFDMIQKARYGDEQAGWSVGNSTQWPAARRWVIYLGLGRPIPATKTVQSTGLIVDASHALREDLRSIPADQYQIVAFLQRCADVLPIADGGAFAQWSAPSAPEVSPGMSLTIRQLEAFGDLSLENRSDTAGMILALGTRPDLREHITHVTWRPSVFTGGAPL